MPVDSEIWEQIFRVANYTPYTIHPGGTMYKDLRAHFWWYGMKRDVGRFVAVFNLSISESRASCTCWQQSLPILESKWNHITMDFIVGLPRSQSGADAVWVIVDKLTKSAHFLPVQITCPLGRLALLYLDEVVRLHGVPGSIVSDHDPRFVLHL